MESKGFKRKLTAILSADVVGYSRLMRDDEETTVHTLNTYKEMIFDLINRNQGRLVDSTGDNLLAEFVSVVDTVRCAVQIQEDLKSNNEELPDNRKMEFRIGINLGDVIQEGERIYGDGVNVAARIESLADPGGICISRAAYDQVKRKLNYRYDYIGEHDVKNIDEPVRVYKVLVELVLDEMVQQEKSRELTAGERDEYSISEKPSIAVLPFVNMSDDPKQEYFSDGVSEEIIGALAKLEGLKVISRTSAFHFKGKDTDLRTIGEKLKVGHVLEGSVRKAGNKLRISAQLIKVADDTHLWSETYDRQLSDVFAIQAEISQAVVKSLQIKLLGSKTVPLVNDYTKNTKAYELFLKGKYFFSKGPFDYEKALGYMEKAIKTDPDLASAYSKLAITHFHHSVSLSLPPIEMWPKIKTLTLKAFAIDKMDADTHVSLGLIKSLYEYDWIGAELNFKRAIELNPANSDAHLQYAQFLTGLGRIDEAIEKMKRALEHDPFSIFLIAMLGLIFYFGHQFEKAITQSHQALELDPNNHMALITLALNHEAQGMYDEGIQYLQPIIKIPIIPAFMAYIYGKAGKREEAHKILEDLLEQSKQGYFSPYMIAAIYGSLGNHDKAFELLEKALEEHDTCSSWIKVDHMFDDLHSYPRWTKLMEKMRLAD